MNEPPPAALSPASQGDPRSGPAMAASRIVVFRMGGQHFGVAVQRVREIVNPLPITPLFRAPDCILGVVNLRGSLIAVLDLAEFLGLGSPGCEGSTRTQAEARGYGEDPSLVGAPFMGASSVKTQAEACGYPGGAAMRSMLMVESVKNGRRVEAAFSVDQVLDVATITTDSIDTAPEVGAIERKYIQGVCLHETRPLTLIDVEAVIGAEMFLRLRGETGETP
ncbi:MAG: purine-binding chemotaxis protein CheW [Nitrospirae bacterium]|nr:purine-binding chemotaxis protein CheW [Nitrospirota bacterium]